MNNEELAALAALVNQETIVMDAENKDRQRSGYTSAWISKTNAAITLENELRARDILK